MLAKGSIEWVILKAEFFPKVQLFCKQSVFDSRVTLLSLLNQPLLHVVVVVHA